MHSMSRKELRLAWLTENHPPSRGGMAQSCDRIVRGLRGRGVDIDLFHFSRCLRRWEERRQRNGRYFACPVAGDPSHALNRLWARLESEGPDYTHVIAFGGLLPLLAGPVFATWLGRPLVSLIRGNDFDAAVFNPRRTQVLREALVGSARACCVSRDKVRKIRALYPGVEALWVPNGIAVEDWALQPFDRTRGLEWRRRFVPDGRRVLGLVGHLKAKKGLLFFLESLLRSGLSEHFHLLLVGDLTPQSVQWLEQQEECLSATLLPFLDRYDLLPYFDACDFVVLPSFYDGMPNVMLEAMALGVPLIAARTGGMADMLEDGVQGFLFHPGDPHGCRRAIVRAADTNPARRQRLGEACAALVRERLGAERETEAYLGILRETLSNEESADRRPAVWRTIR